MLLFIEIHNCYYKGTLLFFISSTMNEALLQHSEWNWVQHYDKIHELYMVKVHAIWNNTLLASFEKNKSKCEGKYKSRTILMSKYEVKCYAYTQLQYCSMHLDFRGGQHVFSGQSDVYLQGIKAGIYQITTKEILLK